MVREFSKGLKEKLVLEGRVRQGGNSRQRKQQVQRHGSRKHVAFSGVISSPEWLEQSVWGRSQEMRLVSQPRARP